MTDSTHAQPLTVSTPGKVPKIRSAALLMTPHHPSPEYLLLS